MHHVKTYTITLIPEDKSVRALCLGVPGCEVRAPSRELALERIEDRLRALIVAAAVDRKPIPVDRTSTKFLWLNVEEFLV